MSLNGQMQKLKEVCKGWVNYFKYANIPGKLKDLDGWICNRIRYCIWRDWKRPERKRKKLIRPGVEQKMAYQWSLYRMGDGLIFYFVIYTRHYTILFLVP